MPVGAMIVGAVSVIVAGAVPYLMLRSRSEDAKLRFYNDLFRSFSLPEDPDSAGSRHPTGDAEPRQCEKGGSV